jgi:predicted nucleic acid-binding protein
MSGHRRRSDGKASVPNKGGEEAGAPVQRRGAHRAPPRDRPEARPGRRHPKRLRREAHRPPVETQGALKTPTLDTQAVIDLLRRDRLATREVEALIRAKRDLFITPHVVFELWRGVRRAPDPEAEAVGIRRLRETFRVLPFYAEAARLAAKMSSYLEERGQPIPDMDIFIAATAVAHGDGVVVTDDEDHFGRLAAFGLTVLPV